MFGNKSSRTAVEDRNESRVQNEAVVTPIMHLAHEHIDATNCDLRVLFNFPAIRHLVYSGHGECVRLALIEAQQIVEKLVCDIETGTACTTKGLPC